MDVRQSPASDHAALHGVLRGDFGQARRARGSDRWRLGVGECGLGLLARAQPDQVQILQVQHEPLLWQHPELVAIWPIEVFERTYDALESDHLGSRKLYDKIVLDAQKGDAADCDAIQETNAAKLTADAKVFRQLGNNAPGITVVAITPPFHQRLAGLVVALSEPTKAWHGRQNVEMRSSSGSYEWLVRQIAGEYSEHIVATLQGLSSAESAQVRLHLGRQVRRVGGADGHRDRADHVRLYSHIVRALVAPRHLHDRGLAVAHDLGHPVPRGCEGLRR